MSPDINQIALHQLIKHDEQNLELALCDSLLEPTEAAVEMVVKPHRVYSVKNKAYGLLSEESGLAQTLCLQCQGEEDFLVFSRATTGCLHDELARYPFADGGFMLFCRYCYLAVEYLLVVVPNDPSSMRVSESLDINPTHYFDTNHAGIVARIDLTGQETNPKPTRYLTFLKGRVGRKVVNFFMDFLGTNEGLDTKTQNRGLLQAVNDFAAEAQLNKTEQQSVHQQVYSYYNGQLQVGEGIELEPLSKELAGVSEVSFIEFAAGGGYELGESFPADRSTLCQLMEFIDSDGGSTISFDAMLLGEHIFWDPAIDTLTTEGMPPNLRDQPQRWTFGGSQSVLYSEYQMRRECLIWPAEGSNTVIRYNLQRQKTPPERGLLQLIQRLSADEVDVQQLRLVQVMLYALSLNFDFSTVGNDGQNFAMELSFNLYVHDFVMIQFDSQRRFSATVDDYRKLVSSTQAVARTFTLLFTYFCVDSKHFSLS